MKKLLSILLATSSLFPGCGSYEYDIWSTVRGTATDYCTGDPLQAVSVMLMPGAYTLQTGADGRFEFTDLEEGQYTLSLQKNGYMSNRKTITAISGEITETTIQLTPIEY